NPRSVSAMDARPAPASGEISLNLRKKSDIPSAPPPLKSYNESRSSLLKNETSSPRSVSARDFSFVPASASIPSKDSKNALSLLPPNGPSGGDTVIRRSSVVKNETSNPRSVSARDLSFLPAAGSTSLNDSKNLLSLLPPSLPSFGDMFSSRSSVVKNDTSNPRSVSAR